MKAIYKLILIITLSLAFSGCFMDGSVSVDDGVNRDENGTALGITNGALDVSIQDQFTEGINLYLSEFLANFTILQNYSIGDTQINISTTLTPVVGNYACLKEMSAFLQTEIIAVTALGGNNYQITLRQPLDYAYTVNGGCSIRNIDMAVDGSVTPRIFTLGPGGTNVDWDLYTTTIHMETTSEPDSEKFGGGTALPNGIVCYRQDGIRKNLFVIDSNADFSHEGFDYRDDNRAPAGVFSITGILNYRDLYGISLRLNNETSDTLVCIVRDDITTRAEELHAKWLGHVVDE